MWSKKWSILPLHYLSINQMASSWGIYIIFKQLFFLSSPAIMSFVSSSLMVMIRFTPSICLILTSQKGVLSFFLYVAKLACISFEMALLRGLFEPSLMMNGKMAIFLMTSFCFFHSYFIFSAQYLDFFSCKRFKSLEFSISMLSVCFLRNEQLRLLFIVSMSEPLGDRLFIVCVIFQRRWRFARQIQVILSSNMRFFFY